jgi:hypothetical protein
MLDSVLSCQTSRGSSSAFGRLLFGVGGLSLPSVVILVFGSSALVSLRPSFENGFCDVSEGVETPESAGVGFGDSLVRSLAELLEGDGLSEVGAVDWSTLPPCEAGG